MRGGYSQRSMLLQLGGFPWPRAISAVSPPCSRQGPLGMISCDAMDIWDGMGVWGEQGAQKSRGKYRTEFDGSDEEIVFSSF